MRCAKCGEVIEAKEEQERLVNQMEYGTKGRRFKWVERVYLCPACAKGYDAVVVSVALAIVGIVGMLVLLGIVLHFVQ